MSLRPLALAALLFVPAACVPPENPCDPDAEPSLRKTASLSGQVKDQDGAPVDGVVVHVRGLGVEDMTDEDGRFVLDELLPNDDGKGYELVASPPAPAVGGRTTAPPLRCNEAVGDIELFVAFPPATPEVELVAATAEDRLLVGFASVAEEEEEPPQLTTQLTTLDAALASCRDQDADAGLRYRVELRPPFGAWATAALALDPRADLAAATIGKGIVTTISEACARSLCAPYAPVYESLEGASARCAEAVGILDEGAPNKIRRLEPFGSYQVRVVAERAAPDPLRSQALPDVLRSENTALPGQLTLAPTSLLPVVLDENPDDHNALLESLNIGEIVPVGRQRFALLDGDKLRVLGRPEDFGDAMLAYASRAPTEALALDEGASEEATAEVQEAGATPLAMLPAGRWVRVLKRTQNGIALDKVFIGDASNQESHDPAGVELDLNIDLAGEGTAPLFRGLSWLTKPKPADPLEEYNPPDGYLALLRDGFLLLESPNPELENGKAMTEAMTEELPEGQTRFSKYLGEPNGFLGNLPRSLTGFCADLGLDLNSLGRGESNNGAPLFLVCFNLAAAMGEALDLRDAGILPIPEDVYHDSTDKFKTLHLFADAAGDRVLYVKTHELVGNVKRSLDQYFHEVPVGVRPTSLHQSFRLLDCEGQEKREPVMLVANQASGDVSVLVATTGPEGPEVSEIAVIGLGAAPARFLEDPDGPSCADPYVWVVTEDGRLLPLDLREDRLEIPSCGSCGQSACAIDPTRGRTKAGAVSRDSSGRSRILVGGRGLIGEVGFLRPALRLR